ncbi:hypothetical protein J3A83DRAFT_4310396 [Scleroderma citrinum]
MFFLSQLSPLEIKSALDEPFLRLLAPHQNIIVTPPREGDEEHLFTLFSDTTVAACFDVIPIPFLRDHGRAMLDKEKGEADALLDELHTLEKESPGRALKFVGGCPLKYVREVQENGTDAFIGYIRVGRARYNDVFTKEERNARYDENRERPVGDSSIRWDIGVALAPSHQGRGIMTAVVGQLLHSWIIPRMNAQHIVAYTFIENVKSVRVFEKNGFVKVAVIDEGIVVRGEQKSLSMLEWRG